MTTVLVFGTWLAMTLSAGAFVKRYGYNMPRLDEWLFVPVLFGHERAEDWVVARHNEHRYPLARLAYLGLNAASGQDFRAGMWVTVGLLSTSAALLLGAARHVRGRSALIDVFIPVLLLNAGHAENLTMGYQIVFSFTVAFVAAFLAVVAWAPALGPRVTVAACGAIVLGLALGGGTGWAFVPGLAAFAVTRLPAVARSSSYPILTTTLLAVPLALAIAYVVGSLIEMRTAGTGRTPNDLPTTLAVAFDFWTVALGGAGQTGYPLPGAVCVGCLAEGGLVAAAIAWARPGERARVAGFAAVVAGGVLLSLAVGVSRPVGNESRYAAFGAIVLCAVILIHTAWGPGQPRVGPGFLLIPACAAGVAWMDWQVGTQFARIHEDRTAMLNRDVRLGLPVNLLAERHVFFPMPGYNRCFELLYTSGHKSLRSAGPPRSFKVVPIPLPPGARLPAWDGHGPAPAFEMSLPSVLTLAALRLEFDCPDMRYFEVYRLELPRNSDDSAGVTSMWLVPGRRTAVFRVEQTLDRIIIRPLAPTTGLVLVKCEAILAD
ncbi:hypothetical protein FRUB_09108 [Fimbriiglobus ruber]|uniref:Glycosyltransferase RgtA/B/C/D-like domain-containing protein n=1 Tax=Fimbriiglobus ruber TaxID=1908690 RepID=A0A225DJH6_9BACT|nr:hypothetical protein FRUB_09108 [Fimbriiglobus ruber]